MAFPLKSTKEMQMAIWMVVDVGVIEPFDLQLDGRPSVA